MERHQVALYVAAILFGVGAGWVIPGSHGLEHAIEPVLALLLFATFLAVPFGNIGAAFRDVRFLGTVGVLNFVLVPLIVFCLSRFVADNDALLIGVLLVLLTPCIDYVIVFAGLAGGAASKLLAAAPLLMLAQILLLPLYLLLFVGPGALDMIDVAPFIEAFLILIVLPLSAAAIVQVLSRRSRIARAIEGGMLAAMVPLMMATLAVVIASQVRGVGEQIGALVRVVPLYIAFIVILVAVGIVTGRAARLDVPATRALTFSGVTRNSLVVLPLALALPASLSLAPLVVVTQTLVELVAMVVLIRVLPRLVPERSAH
jgi:ACR3 family arsenite transporter